MAEESKQKDKEALKKKQAAAKKEGFYAKNVVLVQFPDGKKRPVNKFEADYLKKKLPQLEEKKKRKQALQLEPTKS